MTIEAANGTRAPVGARHLNEEDRATYRRWACGCYAAYSALILALLAVGFWFRDQPQSQMASESRSVGADTMAQPATAPLAGGNRKRNNFQFAPDRPADTREFPARDDWRHPNGSVIKRRVDLSSQ
jgi:hypothetical protein